MVGKNLFTFLVIVTIAFQPAAVAELPNGRSCSSIKNCKKCLNKSEYGCVWHIGTDYQASCMDSEECDSVEGDCFRGEAGNKKLNLNICGNTCGTQTDLSCTDCLSFNAMGKKKSETKRSDCAWYVFGGETQCIFSKRCNKKDLQEGKCIIGKQQADEAKTADKCAAEPKLLALDKCERRDSCHRCLESDQCAWFVQGRDARCISEPRCNDRGFEGGSCTKGANTLEPREMCTTLSGAIPNQHLVKPLPIDPNEKPIKPEDPIVDLPIVIDEPIMEKPIDPEAPVTDLPIIIDEPIDEKPKPIDPEEPVIDLPIVIEEPIDEKPIIPDPDDRDTVGFEECSDFDGMCTDCLNMGCSWINSFKSCVDSCRDAPMDVGCSVLSEPVLREPSDRKLLSFENEASHMCFDFKMEDKNLDLCQKAGANGCRECVATLLFTPPTVYYKMAPTCKWFPQTQSCYPFNSGMMGMGTDQCEDDRMVIYQPFPSTDTTWPELLGQPYQTAEDFLSGTYGPKLEIDKIREGSLATSDYVFTRVRLFVDRTDTVTKIPRIG